MIDSKESQIRGKWTVIGNNVEADANCLRIERLIKNELHEVARDPSGWDVLYIDPVDARHWELTYPDSELHGGGPPMLKHLTKEEARSKYGTI